MKNVTNAFSKTTIIIIIATIVVAVGAGGYFYLYQLSRICCGQGSSLIIPHDLTDYAKGQNADTFLIIKSNDEIQGLLNKYIPMDPPVHFKGALGLVSKSTESAVLVVAFESSTEAENAKTAFESAIKDSFISFIASSIEQKENILLFTSGKGLEGFSGLLLDNPHFKTMRPDLADSQFIFSSDTSQLVEVNEILFALTNTLASIPFENELELPPPPHIPAINKAPNGLISPDDTPVKIAEATSGQVSKNRIFLSVMNSVLSFMKKITIAIHLQNGTITIKAIGEMMDKNELANSPMMQMALKVNPQEATTMQAEEVYDRTMKMLNESMPEAKKTFSELSTHIPETTASLQFENHIVSLEVHFPLSSLDNKLQEYKKNMEKRSLRSRDAVRKADLNKLTAAVEAYYADNGKYPVNSECVDGMEELTPYFGDKKTPKAPNSQENQDFIDNICPDSYLYQSFGRKGYALWATMEDPEMGNSNKDPIEFAHAIDAIVMPPEEKEGNYYVINQINLTTLVPESSISQPTEESSMEPSSIEQTQNESTQEKKVTRIKAPSL